MRICQEQHRIRPCASDRLHLARWSCEPAGRCEHTGSDETGYASAALRPATESGVLALSNAGETMGERTANRALKEIRSVVTAAH
jgi:hypothetical protein